MRLHRIRIPWRGALCAGLLLAPALGRATEVSVDWNTAVIAGGDFSIVFDLIDGDLTSDTLLTLSGFSGFGNPVTPASLTNGASGDLGSTVVLTDSAFFNEFMQGFTPGPALHFTLDYTGSFAGGTPDSFALVLLDADGNPIPTDDPLGTNVFLAIDLRGGPVSIETYGAAAGSGYALDAPITATTPAAGTLWVLLPGLAALRLGRIRKRKR